MFGHLFPGLTTMDARFGPPLRVLLNQNVPCLIAIHHQSTLPKAGAFRRVALDFC